MDEMELTLQLSPCTPQVQPDGSSDTDPVVEDGRSIFSFLVELHGYGSQLYGALRELCSLSLLIIVIRIIGHRGVDGSAASTGTFEFFLDLN